MRTGQLLNKTRSWCSGLFQRHEPIISTGFPELDSMLPDGGWKRASVIEILSPATKRSPQHLIMPLLSSLNNAERWLSWIAPPEAPFGPALAAAGVELSKIQTVQPKSAQDTLWSIEQSLCSGASSIVLGWPVFTDNTVLRRTKEAAEIGDAICVLFRSSASVLTPSFADLRLLVDYDIDGSLMVSRVKERGGLVSDPVRIDVNHINPLALYSLNTLLMGH
ncbi:MAG: SulA-like leucine-rich domain-containing protein [Gammaproteobacteria bacterium]